MKRLDKILEQVGPDGSQIYLALTTAPFTPNTPSTFQLARGTWGSETAYGPERSGLWRADADAGTIPEGTYCYAMRINGRWEIAPVRCPE